MKQKIFFDIARKLKLQSLQPGEITEFQVVSGSMRPLFSLGDTIFVRKTLQNEITTGDIIVWTPAPSEDCMTHRVLNIINQGDSCSYVTRGDNNIYTDGKPIFFETVIGKVICVKKRCLPVGITIDTAIGKRLSGCAALLGCLHAHLFALTKTVLTIISTAYALLTVQWRKSTADNYFLNTSIIDEIDGWRDRASAAQQVLPMGKTPPLYTTADAHLGGGFSEEGMRLSRKGISVTLLPLLHDTGVAHFNTIIAADIITAVPAGKPRKKIYNNLATHLDAGGKLLVSCSGHAATTAEPLTAKIGKLFAFLSGRSAGYYMPFTGNYFTDGRIVKYALSLPQATAELQRAGFSVEQQAQQGHSWALLAVKII